ncbi:urease accessory protein UreD [Actinocrispum wychmicini]|uniref:Urease accessory protein UreD n=1 Tax=Actinocrispum wychmicini TaxID=1213861 RepID=A0A4R2JIE1_9PSEU|nr:urease accessory protein UreD [Actinocrispum wychmicini]TCO58182.1 urease accessory protein [Actinocrispum wychmicini]
MRAHARVVAEVVDGRTVLRELRSMAPLTLVPRRGVPGAVHLVSSAAAPLGGDDLELSLVAGPGATLRLAGVAAALVLPGPTPAVSRVTVTVEAAEKSTVEYRPAATVVTERASHEAVFVASLAADARLLAREVLVLGRAGESPGRLGTVTIVHRSGGPVLNQRLRVGALAASPAVLAGRRVLATSLRVDGDEPVDTVALDWASLVPLAGGGSLATALAHDAVTAGRLLDQLDRSG